MLLSPFLSVSASQGPYNFSATGGGATYDTTSGNWLVNPGTGGVTYTATTSDGAVTKIVISASCTGSCSGGYEFQATCNSPPTPVTTCSTTPNVQYIAGDDWSITVTFYHGSTSAKSVTAQIFPNVMVTPEFPLGVLLASLVPLAALGLYAASKRGMLPY